MAATSYPFAGLLLTEAATSRLKVPGGIQDLEIKSAR